MVVGVLSRSRRNMACFIALVKSVEENAPEPVVKNHIEKFVTVEKMATKIRAEDIAIL